MEEKLYISKCRKDAVIPKYANPGDAGMDIYAAEDVIIEPGCTKLVPTGLKMAIPVGYEVQIRPRSGISLKTMLRIPNAPGTIDSGYRDEVNVIVHNASIRQETSDEMYFTPDTKGVRHGTYMVRKGDRIAQMVIAKVEYLTPQLVESVDDIGENRGGGFGSTGVQ